MHLYRYYKHQFIFNVSRIFVYSVLCLVSLLPFISYKCPQTNCYSTGRRRNADNFYSHNHANFLHIYIFKLPKNA